MNLLQTALLAAATLAIASSSALAAPMPMPMPRPSPLLLPTYGPEKPQTPSPVLKKEGKPVSQPTGLGVGVGGPAPAGKEEAAPGSKGEKKDGDKEEGEKKEGEGESALPQNVKEEVGSSGPDAAPTPGPGPGAGEGAGPSPLDDTPPGPGDGPGDAPTRRARYPGRRPELITIVSTAPSRPPPSLIRPEFTRGNQKVW